MNGTTDLVVLAPDKTVEVTLNALLARPEAFGSARFGFRVFRHPEHDPGCRTGADDFLRSFTNQFSHALVVFDRIGSGGEENTSEELEREVEERLTRAGWKDRACAVVVDPEVEAWIFSDSPEVDRILGWQGRSPALRDWLRAEGILPEGKVKPPDPKGALERALREVRRPRSAALYGEIAKKVSVERCSDRAFLRLKEILKGWFPLGSDPDRHACDRESPCAASGTRRTCFTSKRARSNGAS